jgi:hypothetical protein
MQPMSIKDHPSTRWSAVPGHPAPAQIGAIECASAESFC